MYRSFFKRIFDFVAAVLGLLLLSPLLIVVIIGLFFANHGKPFFFQLRPGKDGKIFKIIKFKTMNEKKDAFGNLLPDEQRLTKIGAFVRKTSLDEIPQLLNVIKGDMSLIGPRPLMTQYLPLYNDFQKRRHEVRPGITGWAQVNGRNGISWDEQFGFDVFYVDRISLSMDFKIFLMTLSSIVKKKGIYSDPKIRTFYFEGNDK
ncbi:Undecaprenyl phosphate N,N'-diacetylbacillosamine 1-phosphate transferase [compost metagenome]